MAIFLRVASANSPHRCPKFIEFLTNLGIPAPTLNAYFDAGLEAIGGILVDSGAGVAFDLLFRC